MKKTKGNKKVLAQWWLRVYWAALTVVLLSMMVQSINIISGAKASDELPVPPVQERRHQEIEERFAGQNTTATPNSPALTTNLTFNEYSCRVIQYADPVIWTLVLLTFVIAGIIYAVSMGQGSGEMSISLAKQMIVAAITGAVLYAFGSLLVGQCGSDQGGLISRMIRGGDTEQTTPGNSISNTIVPTE